MEEKKNWTLKTIAAKLNVSTATVSNAFNRPDQLSEKRRQEILSACAKFHYFGPNQAARSLRKGKTNIVALVLSDSLEYTVTDPVASMVIKGISSQTDKSGYKLLLFSGNSDSIGSVVDFVDGFICVGAPTNSNLIKEIKETSKRVVTMDFDIERNASVSIDNNKAAHEIAKHVLNSPKDQVAILGLRLLDIAHTCRVYNLSDTLEYTVSHQRLQGYQQALLEMGINITPDRIWNIPESTQEVALIAVREALSSTPRPNVLLCMSDRIALAAISEVKRLGLKIPEQVRIVGFDGIDESRHSDPVLTTICQNSEQKGKLVAQYFIENTEKKTVVPYTFQQGESC